MDWQLGIVLIVVAAAAFWLVRQVWRTATQAKQSGCGGCSNCPASEASGVKERPFVSLDSLKPDIGDSQKR